MGIGEKIKQGVEKTIRSFAGSEAILYIPAPKAATRLAYRQAGQPGSSQFGDLRLPKGPGPHPVVMFIHGGFWRARYSLEHAGHLCAALAAQGVATWNVEYRRIGQAGGGWPGTFQDVTAAARYLVTLAGQYSLDPERIILLGHSAGGQLALWLAGARGIPPGDPLFPKGLPTFRAAISLAGVNDLRRALELELSNSAVRKFMQGSPKDFPTRYRSASPIEMLPLRLPHTLFHGSEDEVVPVEISQRYFAEAQKLGDEVELVELPGTGHFELIDPISTAWPLLLKVVKNYSGMPLTT